MVPWVGQLHFHKIWMFQEECVQCVERLAWDVFPAGGDLLDSVSDILLVGENMCKNILDGPGAGNALRRHVARETDPVKEQFKFIALALQALEKDNLVHRSVTRHFTDHRQLLNSGN